jgi:GT2 family glycosyltransferase
VARGPVAVTGRGVDAVVVSFNSSDDLHQLLASDVLWASFDRVLVVDNDSSDDSVAIAREAGAEVIALPANRGFAAAANVGLQSSDAELVVILNPDVEIGDPGHVTNLAEHFQRDEEVSVAAPALRLPDGRRQDSARTVPSPMTLALRRRRDPRRGAIDYARLADVPWVVAAFMMVRRRDALAHGGFDERFFLYFEDVDLCVRLRHAGRRVLYDPTVVLDHHHRGESRGSIDSVAFRLHLRSAARFYRRHPSYLLPTRLRPRRGSDAKTASWRGGIATVAWGAHTTRASEIAAATGGCAFTPGTMGLRGRVSAPVRWAVSAVRTLWWLACVRPRVIVAQNPPIFLGLLVFVYSAVVPADYVLDSHPASFGRKRALRWRVLLPLHRWVARRARAVLVTEDDLRREVESWGGRALILHEPPLADSASSVANGGAASSVVPAGSGRATVLLVCVFAPDEPVGEAIEAARSMAEIDLYVTGETRLAPSGLIQNAPPNVRFVGFLDRASYETAMQAVDLVMTLTTEPTSVMRSAYEAVYNSKPLIVSDWPVSREVFEDAVHAGNNAAELASALRSGLDQLDVLKSRASHARERQSKRWETQLQALVDILATSSTRGARGRT